MNALGTHLLIELKQCNPRLLDNLGYIKETLLAVARLMDSQVVGESFHRFTPQGVTGVLVIAESHISLHTWPELGYAAADIFTCGANFEPEATARLIIDRMESQEPSMQVVERGLSLAVAPVVGS